MTSTPLRPSRYSSLLSGLAGYVLLGCLAGSGWALPPAEQKLGDGPPFVEGAPGQPALPLKRKTGTILALVRAHSETGEVNAGFGVRITAKAMATVAGRPGELGYDQFFGPQSLKSLDAVQKSLLGLHHAWPVGEKVVLSYGQRPSPAELVPATLAEVLLLDSMVRDWDIEPNCALAGAIQPDGTIDAVGAIPERLTGAARANIGRVIVPEKNATEVADFLLSQGIAAFVGTQVFTAKNFNEAGLLSVAQLDAGTKEAVTLFGAVQRTLLGSGVNAVPLLRSERVQATLQTVLAKAPNHLSAKILYEWGTGQNTTISFNGSVSVIDRYAAGLVAAVRAPEGDALKTPRLAVTNSLAGLKYVQDRLDPHTRAYALALLKFGEILRSALGTGTTPPKKFPVSLQPTFSSARQAAQAEWTKMAEALQNVPPATKP